MADKIKLEVNDVQVFYQPGSTTPPNPGPGPGPGPIPPPVGDGLDAARARQRVSQNCLWTQMSGGEAQALDAIIGANTRAQYANFYQIGGTGGLGAFEAADPNSPTGWSFQDFSNNHGGAVTYDVNQAADACVQWFATQQGRTVPPPIVF